MEGFFAVLMLPVFKQVSKVLTRPTRSRQRLSGIAVSHDMISTWVVNSVEPKSVLCEEQVTAVEYPRDTQLTVIPCVH